MVLCLVSTDFAKNVFQLTGLVFAYIISTRSRGVPETFRNRFSFEKLNVRNERWGGGGGGVKVYIF